MGNKEFYFENLAQIKRKIYHFANRFEHCNVYDSNEVQTALAINKYECLAGLGLKKKLSGTTSEIFEQIKHSGQWIFGYFEYGDIIHQTHCPCFLYEPSVVLTILKDTKVLLMQNNGIEDSDFELIATDFLNFTTDEKDIAPISVDFKPQTSRADYLKQVEIIKSDIVRGTYYEMNYCIEFKSELGPRDFLPYFLRLNEKTAAPFAAYVKQPDYTVLCSSPERFALKKGKVLYSQPIKGTNKRLEGDENAKQLEILRNSEKEQAENVMIVDLVRNDMSKVCEPGTIVVSELFGTYAFKTVNHLISTVTGQLKPSIDFKDIMWSLFPMGSMTGAPKTEVMKHIDLYEHAERGIYSGCMGYIEPGGDFDFNVLIRSLVYDTMKSEISYKVGSAITFDSIAEEEYEECILKGNRLFEVMRN